MESKVTFAPYPIFFFHFFFSDPRLKYCNMIQTVSFVIHFISTLYFYCTLLFITIIFSVAKMSTLNINSWWFSDFIESKCDEISLTTFETPEAVLWFCNSLLWLLELSSSVEFGKDSRIFWQWSDGEDLLGEGDMLGVVFHICTDSFSGKNISQICKNAFSNCDSLTLTRCWGSHNGVNDNASTFEVAIWPL